MITDIDLALAYAAGIIDGEGSICITKQKRADCSIGYTYRLFAQVGMADPEVPLWLKQTFGGSLCLTPAKGSWSSYYTWTITTRQSAGFLYQILPYLKIKKGQVEIALEFQKLKRKPGRQFNELHKPFVLVQAEELLAERLRNMHQRNSRLGTKKPS